MRNRDDDQGFPNISGFGCFKFPYCYFIVKLHLVSHNDRDPWKTNLYLYKLEHATVEKLYQLYMGWFKINSMITRLASISIFINKLGY